MILIILHSTHMDLVCQRSWPTLCNELAEGPLFQGLDLFMIGPFLSQHDVPHQWDELWLNLEERKMCNRKQEMNQCQIAFWDKKCCQRSCHWLYWSIFNWCQEASWSTMNRRRNKRAFAQSLIVCTCGVSRTMRKSCWWCWGLQDGYCLWREMSEQHGEWRNSWLSPSQTWGRWLIQACCHHCCSWIGVYLEPLHPGNKCATRIPMWSRVLKRLPRNYLQLS